MYLAITSYLCSAPTSLEDAQLTSYENFISALAKQNLQIEVQSRGFLPYASCSFIFVSLFVIWKTPIILSILANALIVWLRNRYEY